MRTETPKASVAPATLLFDLDGTLLDSLPGIRYAVEHAFRTCGLPMNPIDLRSLIGPPIRSILANLAPAVSGSATHFDLDRLEAAFRETYDAEGWRMTPHYPGAAAALQAMRDSGKQLLVVSNKPRHISMKILEAEGTLPFFDEVVTRDSRDPAYTSKAEMITCVLAKHKLNAGNCLMVGDTIEDADAAAHAGMPFCLMSHGYGDVPLGSRTPVAFRCASFTELEQLTRVQGADL